MTSSGEKTLSDQSLPCHVALYQHLVPLDMMHWSGQAILSWNLILKYTLYLNWKETTKPLQIKEHSTKKLAGTVQMCQGPKTQRQRDSSRCQKDQGK